MLRDRHTALDYRLEPQLSAENSGLRRNDNGIFEMACGYSSLGIRYGQ